MLMKTSLRLRLLVLILVPLLVAAALGQAWQYRKSAQLAENVFDQKLSIMALAIYRDLFVTNGEQLSPATKELFEEASDSQFFYHVRGPDGGFVTGYSPPPLRPRRCTAVPSLALSPGETGRERGEVAWVRPCGVPLH